MKKELQSESLLLLDSALESEHGIKVSSKSPSALRRILYRVIRDQRDLGETRYDSLLLTIGPTAIDEVWILHRQIRKEQTHDDS